RFIIHFVGDIHQPLHGISRVTAALPKGDRGGNDFKTILPAANGSAQRNGNLHMLWDSGIISFPAGPGTGPPTIEATTDAAERIVRRYPESDSGWTQGGTYGYESWSKESFELAKSAVYPGLEPGVLPSQKYISIAVPIVERRVAWAGYRLAAL